MIPHFKSPQHSFLSNFYPCEVEYKGIVYPSSEHAYCSAKCSKIAWKQFCANSFVTAGQIKKEGRKQKLVQNWDEIKVDIMREVLLAKFANENLKTLLINTENEYLQEGNWWGDRFWGVDLKATTPIGENNLGKLLMEIREKIR